MNIVVFFPQGTNLVTSELAHADVWEESDTTLLSEDKMFSEITLDQNREAEPAGLGGLLQFLSEQHGNTAVMCGRLRA